MEFIVLGISFIAPIMLLLNLSESAERFLKPEPSTVPFKTPRGILKEEKHA